MASGAGVSRITGARYENRARPETYGWRLQKNPFNSFHADARANPIAGIDAAPVNNLTVEAAERVRRRISEARLTRRATGEE